MVRCRCQPGQHVPAAQCSTQAETDLTQQRVPGGVPQAVVDLLEAVEVQEQQGCRPLRGRGPEDALGFSQEGAPVGEPGELVGVRLPPDLVEGAHLTQGHGHARQGGEHAADPAPCGSGVQLLLPPGAEDQQAGQEGSQRDGEDAPADAGTGLERDGLVSGRLIGRTRSYSLNPRYFGIKELEAFLLRIAQADPDLRQRATSLRRRPRRAGKLL